MNLDVICTRAPAGGCGFRADDRYFETKRRFRPGVCPRCNGPIVVVERDTDVPVEGVKVDTETGRILRP
jgi:hypothetical protein